MNDTSTNATHPSVALPKEAPMDVLDVLGDAMFTPYNRLNSAMWERVNEVYTSIYQMIEHETAMGRISQSAVARPSMAQEDVFSVIFKHRRHVEQSPGAGKAVQNYALAVIDDIEADLRRSPLADRAAAIHANDCPQFRDFYMKHALGSKSCPSCLMCGHQEHDRQRWAITHAELPDIYICAGCVEKTSSQSAGASAVPERSFSDFIRNATPEEKAKVYSEVMEKAIERQRVFRIVDGLQEALRYLTVGLEPHKAVTEAITILQSPLAGGCQHDWSHPEGFSTKKCSKCGMIEPVSPSASGEREQREIAQKYEDRYFGMVALLKVLLDRNMTFDGRNVLLPFESHDQAINHINEARRAAALPPTDSTRRNDG